MFAAVFNVTDIPEFGAALATSSANGESDTINVSAGLFNIPATLSYYSAESYSLSIIGAGADLTILDGGRARRILGLTSNGSAGDVAIIGIRFQNGVSDDNGAGLHIETESAKIEIQNCIFADDSSDVLGGGINLVSNSGNIAVSNCEFYRNKAEGAGGLNAGTASGNITLTNNLFEENEAYGNETIYADDGGAHMLYTEGGGTLAIRGCTYIGNISEDGGGGAFSYSNGAGTTIEIDSNFFYENYAELDGAACFVRLNVGGTVNITRNYFEGNFAEVGGGGVQVHLENGTINYRNNTHIADSTWADGGAILIWLTDGTFNADSNEFFGCRSAVNGGAFSFATEEGTANFFHNISTGNTAGGVGGAYSFATTYGELNIFNNTSYADSADEGGAIYIYLDQPTAVSNSYNNILWNSSPPAFAGSGAGSLMAEFSNIQGGTGEPWFGTGCIDTDPLFVSAPSGNFRLGWLNFPTDDATKSPCIDTGNPSSPLNTDGTRADMGAIAYNQVTAIFDQIATPDRISISAYPNPFNSAVTITLDDVGAGFTPAYVEIYDVAGRRIAEIIPPDSPLTRYRYENQG